MRRRWKFLILGSCGVIAIFLLCFFCLRDKEPSSNGRTLSEWLERYDTARLSTHVDSDEQEAKNSVELIGTNAFRYLVRWNAGKGSYSQRLLERCAEGAPSATVRKFFVRLIGNNTSEKRHRLANAGFRIFRTSAIAALPDITVQFANEKAADPLEFMAYSLAQLGLPGIAALSNTVSADALHRQAALDALTRLTHYTRDESILNAATNAMNSLHGTSAQSASTKR